MGVRGLKGFVDRNECQLLRRHKLSNTKLIVDGHNILNLVYERYSDNHEFLFNGNYVQYADDIRDFCKKLLACNVEPVFVFDGGMDRSGQSGQSGRSQSGQSQLGSGHSQDGGQSGQNDHSGQSGHSGQSDHSGQTDHSGQSVQSGQFDSWTPKLGAKLSRLRDHLKGLERVWRGDFSDKFFRVLPPVFGGVLCAVLDDLDIAYFQCFTDADSHVASLANHFNCPVLSGDGDFFVFELRGGLILSDSLFSGQDLNIVNYYEVTESVNVPNPVLKPHIECKIYFSEYLLQSFPNLSPRHLPLFACLAGNEHLPPVQKTIWSHRNRKEITVTRYVFEDLVARQPIDGIEPYLAADSYRHRSFLKSLAWLDQMAAAGQQLHQIESLALAFLAGPEPASHGFEDLVPAFKFSLEQYRKGALPSYLLFYLDRAGAAGAIDKDRFQRSVRKELGGQVWPFEFLDAFCRKKVPSDVIDVALARTYVYRVAINDLTLPSSSRVADPIRRHYFGLLRFLENDGSNCVRLCKKTFSGMTFHVCGKKNARPLSASHVESGPSGPKESQRNQNSKPKPNKSRIPRVNSNSMSKSMWNPSTNSMSKSVVTCRSNPRSNPMSNSMTQSMSQSTSNSSTNARIQNSTSKTSNAANSTSNSKTSKNSNKTNWNSNRNSNSNSNSNSNKNWNWNSNSDLKTRPHRKPSPDFRSKTERSLSANCRRTLGHGIPKSETFTVLPLSASDFERSPESSLDSSRQSEESRDESRDWSRDEESMLVEGVNIYDRTTLGPDGHLDLERLRLDPIDSHLPPTHAALTSLDVAAKRQIIFTALNTSEEEWQRITLPALAGTELNELMWSVELSDSRYANDDIRMVIVMARYWLDLLGVRPDADFGCHGNGSGRHQKNSGRRHGNAESGRHRNPAGSGRCHDDPDKDGYHDDEANGAGSLELAAPNSDDVMRFLYAYIAMLLYQGLLHWQKSDPCNTMSNGELEKNYNFMLSFLDGEISDSEAGTIRSVLKNFKKFGVNRFGKEGFELDFRTVHFYAQLQSIQIAISTTNVLLGAPFRMPKVEIFYNGVLLHNLAAELKSKGCRNIWRLLNPESRIGQLFKEIFNCIVCR